MRKFLNVFFILIFSFAFFSTTALSQADLSPQERAQLEKELADIERQIKQQQGILNEKKTEGQSISRDIAILNAQIKGSQLKIQAHNISINKLGKDITVKVKNIDELNGRINEGTESLADMLNKRNQLDSYSVAEAFLAHKNFAEFFQDFEVLASLQEDLNGILNEVKDAKSKNEIEKENLSEKRDKEIDTKVNVENEQKKIKVAEAEKKRLLSLNQKDQKSYQTVIAQQQAKAGEIRNRLFPLRDAGPIKFEDAIKYAKDGSATTGVRPAFILAILKQETNLGANVGQCYLTDPDTGAGKGKNTGTPFANVMKPTRDVAPFLDVTKRLGRDPYATVVSCPQSIGYGGAMGPSQFIASTWVMYEAKVENTLGVKTADPWNAQHAFMATALFLGDLGAGKGGYSAEREAAGRYYAGGGWATNGLGYAASVLSIASGFQTDIDFLQDQ